MLVNLKIKESVTYAYKINLVVILEKNIKGNQNKKVNSLLSVNNMINDYSTETMKARRQGKTSLK